MLWACITGDGTAEGVCKEDVFELAPMFSSLMCQRARRSFWIQINLPRARTIDMRSRRSTVVLVRIASVKASWTKPMQIPRNM